MMFLEESTLTVQPSQHTIYFTHPYLYHRNINNVEHTTPYFRFLFSFVLLEPIFAAAAHNYGLRTTALNTQIVWLDGGTGEADWSPSWEWGEADK